MTNAENAEIEHRVGALPTVDQAVTVDERLGATDPAFVLPRQLVLAQDRAAWLGEKLRAQIADEGMRGLVGDTYTVTLEGRAVRVGEYARVLYEQERREREHVAALAERVARLGLDVQHKARRTDLERAMAHGIKAAFTALGHATDGDGLDEEMIKLAQSAFYVAWREQTGERIDPAAGTI